MKLPTEFAEMIAWFEEHLPPGRSYTFGKGKLASDEPHYAVAVYRNDDDGLAEVNQPEFVCEDDSIANCVARAIAHFQGQATS